MGCGYIIVHGFRSSFRDWAGDTTLFPKAEAAYARSTQLSKSKLRDFMEAWALYCSTPQVSVQLKTSKYAGIADLIRKA